MGWLTQHSINVTCISWVWHQELISKCSCHLCQECPAEAPTLTSHASQQESPVVGSSQYSPAVPGERASIEVMQRPSQTCLHKASSTQVSPGIWGLES